VLRLTNCDVPGLLGNGRHCHRDLDLSRSRVAGAHETSASTSQTAAIWLCEAARAPRCCRRGRLDEVTGIGRDSAQEIIAEVGLGMSAFPTPAPGPVGKLSCAPCSPGLRTAPGPPAMASRTCEPLSVRPVLRQAAPIPSSASGTGGPRAAAA
jgi:hypothetical protein